jgi:hypothetical protein
LREDRDINFSGVDTLYIDSLHIGRGIRWNGRQALIFVLPELTCGLSPENGSMIR